VSVLVFYISGHGFGHASRDIEVINALGQASPSLRVVVRTAAPRWLFHLTVQVPHEFHHMETDTGVVQHDSLTHDIPQTMRVAAAFYSDFDRRVERESEFLKQVKATIVVGDIPPLAFAAGARAGVPSYALGNFTWDWIYEGYDEGGTLAPGIVETMRRAYAHAREAWRLPMHGGFGPFSTIVDVPFIARQSHREPEETRRALGLPLHRKVVLLSFGGYGLRSLPLERIDCLNAYDVVVAEASLGGISKSTSPAVHAIVERDIYSRGFRYEDLVRAADVVVTKPGFGIIAECLANNIALVYTSRGAFREYDVLVEEMPRFLRCGFIDQDSLFAGRWRASLDAVLAQAAPPTSPQANGAEDVAARIIRRLEKR